jgi:hypothetical protein
MKLKDKTTKEIVESMMFSGEIIEGMMMPIIDDDWEKQWLPKKDVGLAVEEFRHFLDTTSFDNKVRNYLQKKYDEVFK